MYLQLVDMRAWTEPTSIFALANVAQGEVTLQPAYIIDATFMHSGYAKLSEP